MRSLRLTSILLLAATTAVLALGCGGGTTEPKAEYSVISTYMGTGEAAQGADGLAPDRTALYWPQDITFGPNGNAYVADWNNHRIRMVENGIAQTIIGTGELGDADDGLAAEASLNHPTHVSFDPLGRLILSAWHNSKIIRYDFSTKMMQTICGDGRRSFAGDGGPAENGVLDLPAATAWESSGRMYIMDQANQRIRFIDNGTIDTFAGKGTPPGYEGDGGLAKDARFNMPVGQAAAPAGKVVIDRNDVMYVADTGNHVIRRILPDDHPAPGARLSHETNIIELFAGTPKAPGVEGEGVPATQAKFRFPNDVAVAPNGDVFIADTYNHCVRRVDQDGIITTFAGQLGRSGYGGDGGHPADALLNQPVGLEFDAEGNLYIADRVNNRIRVVWKNP
jgi:hypothetical protein